MRAIIRKRVYNETLSSSEKSFLSILQKRLLSLKPPQHLQPAVTTTKFAESAQPAQPSFLELRSEVLVDAPEEVDDIWPEAREGQAPATTPTDTQPDTQNAVENIIEHVAEYEYSDDISDDISDVWPETYDFQQVENAEYHYVAKNNNEWVCTICGALVSLQHGFCMECFDTSENCDISFNSIRQ